MRGVKKRDLPSKICPVCTRPFTWRKKWAAVWDEVIYCSDRCRRHKRTPTAVLTKTVLTKEDGDV